jgi:RTX calcium-binding nonapeptide repeat (4 copies)
VTGGTPILALNDGGAATYDAAHSTATTLVFDYTVGKHDPATSSLAITGINLNGATIKDAGGNAADLSAAQAALPGAYINLNLNNNYAIVSGANATISLGNGSDTVTAGANSTVSLGNGNGTVTVGNNSTITLGNGNDTVTAGSYSNIRVGNGNDTIYAGANDIINLGRGHDTVAFGLSPNPGTIGNETVGGFDPSKDVLLFNHELFVNFAAVMSAAKPAGHDTVITRDTNDSVTLQGVALSSLTASNFHFA